MRMNVFQISFICTVCILLSSPLFAYYSLTQDTVQSDTVVQVKPDYENVTVSVTTDWGCIGQT
jgi:hypothetical protein